MRRYEPKPWDIRRCDMIHADEGEYVLYCDAQTEIERLTKERDEARAQVAATYEAATSICADQFAAHMNAAIYGDPDNSRAREAAAAMAERLLHSIRALTPAGASAALEAYGRDKVREGMRMAADIALCHSDDRPRRYSMDWNDGYIDGCKGVSNAILTDMEKLK